VSAPRPASRSLHRRGWLPSPERRRCWRRAGPIPASDQHFEGTLNAELAGGSLRSGKVLEPGVPAWTFDKGLSPEGCDRIRARMFGHTLAIEANPNKAEPARSNSASAS
jgi:hypothetical protein